jgi:hypothetical protein
MRAVLSAFSRLMVGIERAFIELGVRSEELGVRSEERGVRRVESGESNRVLGKISSKRHSPRLSIGERSRLRNC